MTDVLQLGNNKIKTLVAISEEEQAKGLMFRSWPPPVMSFPFPNLMVRKFWMKNTPSPLDIIFCRAGKVIDIFAGIPFSDELVGPDVYSDLVIELPYGQANSLKITAGSNVNLVYSLVTLGKIFERKLAKRS